MKRCTHLVITVSLAFSLVSAARAQVPPEKAEATFKVADGLEFKLWASEPLFVNPTCMDIDHKGRVWVCESVNYRCTLHRRPLNRKEGDRIVILEDTKGTGKADKAATFYQSPELLAPLGIAVAPYPDGKGCKVFVCQSPDILVFEDKDGDGKADGPPKKLLTGFGGIDHDHGVHGILIGPDGKLYFSVGDQGIKNLQSSDGKGRKWTSNDTDCRAGTIWRCDMDGTNLELIAHNFRNEYEPCVDSFGTIFTSDNDDDGNEQTRICYVMPGGDYGYNPRGPGQSHWHEEKPGVVPKILRTGFGSPTGMCVYEGTLLPLVSPTRKRGGFTTQLLHTDAGPREVRCYHLKPDGAGYQVDKEVLVSSTDTWFRPSDICVAPDGSAFVTDWYDPGVGGHGMGDTTRGRIYRMAPVGSQYRVPNTEVLSNAGIIAALGNPSLSIQALAKAKLGSMKSSDAFEVVEPLIVGAADPILKARASWIAPQVLETRDWVDITSHLMREDDDRFRCQALRIWDIFTAFNPNLGPFQEKFTRDNSVRVRREFLLLLRRLMPETVLRSFHRLADGFDGHDRFYLEAIGIAVGHHDKKRREIILADFDKEFPEWNDKVADLVWELQPPSVMPRLEKLLTDSKLTGAQRGRIIDILAASEDKNAGKVLIKALQVEQPAEVRDRIFENLKLFLPGKWQELRKSDELHAVADRLLALPEGCGNGLKLVAAAEITDSLGPIVFLAKDSKNQDIRRQSIQTIGQLHTVKAVNVLDSLVSFFEGIKQPELSVEAVRALGTQINQWRDKPASEEALRALQKTMLAKETSNDLKRETLSVLAGTRKGNEWLLAAHAKKELPAYLVADAGRLLRNSPHQDLRNRAMIAFPPPAKIDPKKVPAIAALVTRKGDAKRGQELLAASVKSEMQCLKCHTVNKVGGQIGPDLSAIGKKASRDNLFESILYPSKAIADQYVTWNIETNKGVTVSGLLIEETKDHVLLRDANGKDTKIPTKEIESRTKSLVSIMPADLLAYMTEDELVDIVEYLMTLKTE
jgi:putative membrane-bound dehydrogenase-like protein